MRKPSLKHPRGVTLVELMVVVTIIAVLAALAGPTAVRSMERAAAKGNARDVANILRTARNQAMSRGETIYAQIQLAATGTRGSIQLFRTDVDPGEPGFQPARSCRQFDAAATFLTAVNDEPFTLDGASGESILVGADPMVLDVNGNLTLCFSPDGRILDTQARAITGGTATCPTENFVLWIADGDDIAQGNVTDQMNCVTSAAERPAKRDARDIVNLYRITVPYNGSIQMMQ